LIDVDVEKRISNAALQQFCRRETWSAIFTVYDIRLELQPQQLQQQQQQQQ
jgi:hypothetical protein